MKVIYKYPVDITDEQVIKIPLGSKILSVIEQNNKIVLYAIVHPGVEYTREIILRIVGTGHEIPFSLDDFKFMGSVKLHDGQLVFHVFVKEGCVC